MTEVSDVKIYFTYTGSLQDGGDSTSYQIWADITPVSSGVTAQEVLGTSNIADPSYVVAGTAPLTGYNWDTGAADRVMTKENPAAEIYTYTFHGISGGKNYAYTVVPQGVNRSVGTNHFLYLQGPEDVIDEAAGTTGYDQYDIKITYDLTDPGNPVTALQAYADTGSGDPDAWTEVTNACVVDELKQGAAADGLIEFYSVAGDQGLTGYNWFGAEGDSEQVIQNAVNAGKMTRETLGMRDGWYSITYPNVPVGTDGGVITYSFKVVANGDWDYGIDYGRKGANYVLSLSAPEGGANSCNVAIRFKSDTGEIQVSATDISGRNYLSQIDETKFKWYITGNYLLVSEDAYTSERTVYDTVRDITTAFDFTSDSRANSFEPLTWETNEERNQRNQFKSTLGDHGFQIGYHVDGKDSTGIFAGNVLSLEQEQLAQGTGYRVSKFMPGKQWVEVATGTADGGIPGTRSLRLIPTAYLEAGNSAGVQVWYEAGNTLENTVRVSPDSEDGIYAEALGGQNYSYYNFALTAGYAITDKVGLGIYDNYERQGLQAYDSSLSSNRIEAENTYFAMYSAFAEAASYEDGYADGRPDSGRLQLDTLTEQALIGSSVQGVGSTGDRKAQTIVKVYRIGRDTDGNIVSTTKIMMDADPDSVSAYHDNYLKWTGQKLFEAVDVGEYLVSFYWALADGRYLEDSKTVQISAESGDLRVRKIGTGEGFNEDLGFRFTVTLDPLPDGTLVNGWYGDMFFDYGTSVFILKKGESRTAMGIPKGVAYRVDEEPLAADYDTTYGSQQGVIGGGIVIQVDCQNDIRHGDLTVVKRVTGAGGDQTRNFNFTLTLDNRYIDGVYGDMDFEDGVAHFTLHGGESKTAAGLPSGTAYSVVEESVDGYVASAANASGTILADTTVTAEYVNEKTGNIPDDPDKPGEPEDREPPVAPDTPEHPADPSLAPALRTGDDTPFVPWLCLLISGGAGMAAVSVGILKARNR